MPQDLLVSAVIPTFNRAHTIGAAIESALSQTYPRTEVIVVDDGSTDATHDVLRRYNQRIRVIRQGNAGPSVARNAGVRASRGELVAFLDSDDLWLPNKLETQVDTLSRAGSSVACCVCNVRLHAIGGRIGSSFAAASLRPVQPSGVWLNPFEVLATRFLFFNQALLLRRAVFEHLAGFDERLRFLEDYDLALRLALLGPWAFVAEPLVVWQQGTDSLSREALLKVSLLKESELAIRERLLSGHSAHDNKRRRLMRRQIRRNRLELAAERLSQSRSGWQHALAATLRVYGQWRNAINRRSPWYPSMRVTSLDRWSVQSTGAAEKALEGEA